METVQTDQVQPELRKLDQWGLASRVAFRFCFVYFGVYCLSTSIITGLVSIPNFDIPDLSSLMRPLVFWTGAHIFGISKVTYTESGSGDRTVDWLLLFLILVFSLVALGVWSVLDRRRPNYVTLHKWFRLFIRFCLASAMINYGMVKAIPLQMPFPGLTRLLEHYGDFSHFGVLWSTIGAAPGYEIFAGCAELVGAVLLIFPRTATLGALVCVADMIQVFMLNMTYDVPVKLGSFHLMLLSLFVLAPDLQRLATLFFLNRSVAPSTHPALFAGRRANRIALAAQIVVGVWLLGMNAYGARVAWYRSGGGRTVSPLYGIWEVEQQTIDGELRAPLLTDSGRWRRAIFDSPPFDVHTQVTFQHMDESFAPHRASIDLKNRSVILTDDQDKSWKANFTFDRTAPDHMTLDGKMDGHTVHMQLKLMNRNQFMLLSRGFHWIHEYPFAP